MSDIHDDLRFLSGNLEHRLAQTEEEECAADYMLARLKPLVQTAQQIEYGSVENYRLVFAAYYAEFVVTGLLAFWWPTIAFFYGLTIFFAYMAEYIGFRAFSRFFPHYESKSVVGFNPVENPECNLVFTAYLDSNDDPGNTVMLPALRWLHRFLIVAMVVMLAACAIDALGLRQGQVNPAAHWIRLGGIAVFSISAVAVLLGALLSTPSRGANHNASGLAALLQIAERLQKRTIKNASVLFFAAGSHYANMGGMRVLLKGNPVLLHNTYLINIEGVGAGTLCYTEAEGILRDLPCSPALVAMAEKRSKRYHARAARIHDFATNAYLPLMRGVASMSLVGLDERDLPVHFDAPSDLAEHVDADAVLNAARYAESIARGIVKEHLDCL